MNPKRVLRALSALALATLVVLMGACGPSFQAIYEGNARFEHCYALEESPQTVVREKVDCWRDWSEHYTFGQTRDRIHYATARYVALSQASSLPTDEAMMMAAPGMTPRQSAITAPSPTNAFAPPPKVLEDFDAGNAGGPATPYPGMGPPTNARPLRPGERPVLVGPGSPSSVLDAGAGAASAGAGAAGAGAGAPASAAGPPLPGTECADGCATKLRECKDTCSSVDAGARAAKPCTACEKTYRGCMRGCFK